MNSTIESCIVLYHNDFFEYSIAIHPRRKQAARAKAVWSVCVLVNQYLTLRISNHALNKIVVIVIQMSNILCTFVWSCIQRVTAWNTSVRGIHSGFLSNSFPVKCRTNHKMYINYRRDINNIRPCPKNFSTASARLHYSENWHNRKNPVTAVSLMRTCSLNYIINKIKFNKVFWCKFLTTQPTLHGLLYQIGSALIQHSQQPQNILYQLPTWTNMHLFALHYSVCDDVVANVHQQEMPSSIPIFHIS